MDWQGIGTALVGLAACITAIAQLRQGRQISKTADTVSAVHEEVRSANGITGTELIERAEGRRIKNIPKAGRTVSEQGYVDRLEAQGRNMGHSDDGGTP